MQTRFRLAALIGVVAPVGMAHAAGLVVGMGTGGAPLVGRFDGPSGADRGGFFAYAPSFQGGVTVASGDVNGDGVADIVTGTGTQGSHVKVFDGVTGAERASFFAFAPNLAGGVTVASGDVDGDGRADIVVGAGSGAGVKVFSGHSLSVIHDFTAFSGFAGGVRVATGDVNGDGFADIVTGAGEGGGGVRTFHARNLGLLNDFLPFDAGFTRGVNVATGDLDGDGRADLFTAVGGGSGPQVKLFDGATLGVVEEFFAFDTGFTGGVRVAAGDVNGDGVMDVVTGAGPGVVANGGGPRVRVFDGRSFAVQRDFFAADPAFDGGVFVAAAPVPEPATLLALGLGAVALVRRRRRGER